MPKDMTTATFMVDAAPLVRALAFAMQATDRRMTIPILCGNLFNLSGDRLTITGTDLDMVCEATCDVAGSGGNVGFVMDGRMLMAFVRAAGMDAVVSVTVSDDKHGKMIEVKIGETVLVRRGLWPVEDWPSWKQPPMMERLPEIGEAEMRTALDRVSVAISTEETRYYLNGVFFTAHPETKALRLVTTDGHRMGIYDLDQPAPGLTAILRKRASEILRRALTRGGNDVVGVWFGDNHARFETPAGIIRCKLIDGTYPAYERVLPSAAATGYVGVTAAMVRQLMVVSSQRTVCVAFCPESGRVKVNGPNWPYGDGTLGAHDWGEVSMPMQWSGQTDFGEFGINGHYLADWCRAAGGPVKIEGDNPNNPFRVLCDDPRFLGVQMPMRV